VPPRVVVITDRRSFPSEEIAGHLERVLDAAPLGSVAIQIREKDLDGGPLLRLVGEVVEIARPRGAPVWVNDRLDVALAAGCDGVHLPERGLSIADARHVIAAAASRALRDADTARVPAPPRIAIGCSRHTAAAALAAATDGAALVQLGPIWQIPGKGPPLGVEPLAIRAQLSAGVQLVAVGGIDSPTRARAAALAGADAVAVIRAAWRPDSAARIAYLVAAVDDAARERRAR
jgi:thiamine-phosphate pyrophosphorylase